MAYKSPKTGSVINPGKRKKLPKSKVSRKTQLKNQRKWLLMPFRVSNNKYKEGE